MAADANRPSACVIRTPVLSLRRVRLLLVAPLALLAVYCGGSPPSAFPPTTPVAPTVEDAGRLVDAGLQPLVDAGSFGDAGAKKDAGAPADLFGYPTPTLSSLTPSQREAGEAITIRGEYFSLQSALNQVVIAGQTVPILQTATRELVVRIPLNAPADAGVVVITPGGVSQERLLRVLPPPGAGAVAPPLSIDRLSPVAFRAGDTVRIEGSGFTTLTVGQQVTVAGVQALVTRSDATSLDFEAPVAPAGPVIAQANGRSSNPIEGYSTAATSGVSTLLETIGARARDYLSDETHTHLVVEVDHSPSLPPDPQVLDLIAMRLTERLNKPGGVLFVVKPQLAERATWTYAEVKQSETDHRDHFGFGSANVAVYYASVLSHDAEGKAAGYAYSASSMVIFKQGQLGPYSASVEGQIAVHEFGHNLGLVNRGTPALSAHEDLAHPKHCSNTGCVMFWVLSSTVVLQFDAACIADIQGNGGR